MVAYAPTNLAWFNTPHYDEEGRLAPTTLDGKYALLAMHKAHVLSLGTEYKELLQKEVRHAELVATLRSAYGYTA